jgi:hypothetical protein
MDKEKIHNILLENLKKEHAFWSYETGKIQSISDNELIASVLLYLDMDDILILFKIFPRRKILKVWKERMLAQEPMYHNLNRLYSYLLFNIKNPDKYINNYRSKQYKSLTCKD